MYGFVARLIAVTFLAELGDAQTCVTHNVLDQTSGTTHLDGADLGACAYIIATGQATCAEDFVHGGAYAGVCNYECGYNTMDASLGPGQCSSLLSAGASCADSFAASRPYAGYCDFECGYCSHAPPTFNCQADEHGTAYIGGLFDSSVDSESLKSHFQFAAALLDSKSDGWFDELLPGIGVNVRAVDTECSHVAATSALWALSTGWEEHTLMRGEIEWNAVPLHGVVTAFGCEQASKGTATLTRLQQTPQVSGAETSPALSDTEAYSYHFRTVSPQGRESRQLKALLKLFHYGHNVGLIYTDTSDARASAMDFITTWTSEQLGEGGNFRGTVLSQCQVELDPNDVANRESAQQCFLQINELPKQQRPKVIVLVANGAHGREIISTAVDFYRPGGFHGWDTGKTWVGLGSWVDDNAVLQLGSEAEQFLGLRQTFVSAEDCSDFNLLNEIPSSACTQRRYLERWQDYQRDILGLHEDAIDQQLCHRCAETIDALVALAYALDAARCEVAGAGIHNLEHGDRVREYLRNVTFNGLSGPIAFDEAGDRQTTQFGIYIRDSGGAEQWRRLATLTATTQGGVEPMEEETGVPPISVADMVTQIEIPAIGTYANDGFCRDGTECVDPSLPHCDVDYDPVWRWEPGATNTVDGIPRSEVRGTCVAHADFVRHSCAAPMHLHQDARGSTHHMTLYGNDTTSCYRVNATTIECRKGGRDQPAVAEPLNLVASLCAEYLPDYVGADEVNGDKETEVCCRQGDRKLESWFLERWQEHEIRFGQCENCRDAARRILCQSACDTDNWRFHASSKALSPTALSNSSTHSDAMVCPQFCTNVYKACRDIVWTTEIKNMPQYRTPDDPESGMFKFCSEGLRLDVSSEVSWAGLGGAWSVDENDPIRICTESSLQEPIHCTSDRAYRSKGLAGTVLCVFAVLSLLGTDKITNRMLPSASVTLFAGLVTGFLIDNVFSVLEQEIRGTHDLVNSILLRPEALGLFLLPLMIFSTAFNVEHHVTIFMWLTLHRISLFAIVGTILSILCTAGSLLALDGALEDGLLEYDMTFQDAMMFGSLISALDPGASMAVFARIGIDPRVHSLVCGESLLSRCVSVVMFGTFKQIDVSKGQGEDPTSDAMVTFCVLCIGSMVCGLAVGALTTLFYKFFGDRPESDEELQQMHSIGFVDDDAKRARQMSDAFKALDTDGSGTISKTDFSMMDADKDGEIDKLEFRNRVLHDKDTRKQTKDELHYKHRRAIADACTFFFSSMSSYYAAEALNLSGIMSASICAVVCNQFAVRNMTFDARDYGKSDS